MIRFWRRWLDRLVLKHGKRSERRQVIRMTRRERRIDRARRDLRLWKGFHE